MTDEKIIQRNRINAELGDILVDAMIEERGFRNTVIYLLDSGYTPEQLLLIGFNPDIVWDIYNEYKAPTESTESIPLSDVIREFIDKKTETSVCKRVIEVENLKDLEIVVDSLTNDEAVQLLIKRTYPYPFLDEFTISVADLHYAGEYFDADETMDFDLMGIENAIKLVSVLIKTQAVKISVDGAFNNVSANKRPLVVSVAKVGSFDFYEM